jgi:hypothetical protein
MFSNRGSGTCLEAKASDVPNDGSIIQWACNSNGAYQQWACDSTGDPYQRWHVRGSGQVDTNGNANAGLENVGSDTRLDANGNGGAIIQWGVLRQRPVPDVEMTLSPTGRTGPRGPVRRVQRTRLTRR